MINWIPPETAPRDGGVFLGKFKGYEKPMMCFWNGRTHWIAAEPRSYYGFTNNWLGPDELEVWAEL